MKRHHAILTAVVLSLNLGAASAQDPEPQHAHASGHDDRVVLELTPTERAMILEEMRLFLGGVGQLSGALGRQDMAAAAEAASALGPKLATEVPPALRAKLPQDFRQLGASVHRDFAQIALDANSLGDVSHSLSQLSATLQKCVACHAAYQIRTPAFNDRH